MALLWKGKFCLNVPASVRNVEDCILTKAKSTTSKVAVQQLIDMSMVTWTEKRENTSLETKYGTYPETTLFWSHGYWEKSNTVLWPFGMEPWRHPSSFHSLGRIDKGCLCGSHKVSHTDASRLRVCVCVVFCSPAYGVPFGKRENKKERREEAGSMPGSRSQSVLSDPPSWTGR